MLPRLPRVQQNLILIILFIFALWYTLLSGRGRSKSAVAPPLPKARLSTRYRYKDAQATIVVAAASMVDTHWVEDELPDWNSLIYFTDSKRSLWSGKSQRGNEANVYLKYIIDHYDDLTDVIVFTSGQRESYLIDRAFPSTPNAVRRLNLETVKREGYVSLSCRQEPRCDIKARSWWDKADRYLKDVWPELLGESTPPIVSAPIFYQFAVTREAIRSRPRSDYQRMKVWLQNSKQDAASTNRIFEHSWHYIFGKDPVLCQLREECLCDAYELCDQDRPEVRMALDVYKNQKEKDEAKRQRAAADAARRAKQKELRQLAAH